MATAVSIVNNALVKLGVSTISALTDDSPQARIATRTFDQLRDDLLREHTWNWATKRVSLSASATSPEWEYTYAYVLPSDYIRLVSVNNPSKYPFQIEVTSDGPVIVTDLSSPLEIKYIAKITNVSYWDSKFCEVMSARFAMEWAEPLTGVSTLKEQMEAEYIKKLRDAKAVDGQEDSVSEIDVSPWISSRW